MLKNGILKRQEEHQIDEYGVDINIQTYVLSPCTICKFDPLYKTGNKPNCPVCGGTGKIKTPTDHIIKTYVKWYPSITEDPTEAGALTPGDCRLKAKWDTKWLFEDALRNGTRFLVEGTQVLVVRVIPSVIQSSVKVYCGKTEVKKGL